MPTPFFLDREDNADRGPQQFEALGHAGSAHYAGLETFPNPGCGVVQYTCDELMAKCPVTSQPDFYTVVIQLRETEKLIESKSLKLFFQGLIVGSLSEHGSGIFCEGLAVHLRTVIAEAIGAEEDQVGIQLDQKSRGGISIRAMA
jgi:NADPH-dependent 7-cyano-7-deazaguanine reductase QueF